MKPNTHHSASEALGGIRSHVQGQYAIVFSLLIVLVLLVGSVWVQHRDTVNNAFQQTRNLTRILAIQLEAELDRVEGALNFVEFILNTLPREHQTFSATIKSEQKQLFSARLHALKNSFSGIEAINVFDAQGNLLYSSNAGLQQINIADRPHFQTIKNNRQVVTYYSDIISARTTGVRSFAVLRSLHDNQGQFYGVISIILAMDWIDSKLADIDMGTGGVVLLRNSESTTLISRFPRYNEDDFNLPLPIDNPIRQRIDRGDRNGELRYVASTDAYKRLGSFQVLQRHPFYFQAAMSEEHYLSSWRQYTQIVTAIALLLIVSFILILWRMNHIHKTQQQALTRLTVSEQKFRSLFDQSVDEIYLHDLDGKILDVNRAAATHSGYSREQLRNMYVFDLWPNDDNINEVVAQWRSWAVGAGTQIEQQHVKADGSLYPVDIHTNKIEYDNKQLILAILRDITLRKQSEEDLQKSAVSLQRNNADLLRLGEIMAHHFQESTRRMVTFARVLNDQPCLQQDPDGRHAVTFINEQAARLSKLVRRVQRYLEIDESPPVETSAADVRSLIEKTLSASAAADADIDIATELPNIWLPPTRLNRILSIVFDNCGHYRRAHVPLVIQVSAVTAADQLELRIADNGSGIDLAHRDKVLELFTNLATGNNSGSGLALARRIMRLAGGDLKLENGIDGGVSVVLMFKGG